jgi:hypothetical protein
MLVVPSPVLRAEAEEAAGREGAPSGDVVPSQAIEAEAGERRWHWPLVMMLRHAMATPMSTALNKREAVSIDRRNHLGNLALRKRIWRMGAWWCRRTPDVRHGPSAAAMHRRPALLAEALVHGHPHNRLWGKPLVRGNPRG